MGELLEFPEPALADLRQRLQRELSGAGYVQANVGDLDVPVEQWRKAARAAARQLSRPVETAAFADIVVASLKDWPATAEEERIQSAALRRAAEAAWGPLDH